MYGQVYLITNKKNGKIYIGQTIRSLKLRYDDHFYSANRPNKSYNIIFSKALRKYGKDGFTIECICVSFDRESLNEAEVALIKDYDSRNKSAGYNLAFGGNNGAKEIKITEETRQRLRDSHKGKKPSQETRDKMSRAHTGKIFSQELRDKISKAQTGRKGHGKGRYWLGKKRLFCDKVKAGMYKTGPKHHSSRKVIQLNDKKEPIKIFDSLTIAQEQLKVNNVSLAISAGVKRGGFYWEFKK